MMEPMIFHHLYNNINHRQRSQTLNVADKNFILRRYFDSLKNPDSVAAMIDHSARANYANVPIEPGETNLMHQHPQSAHSRHHHHQHFHSRSQSHTLHKVNDFNNYYNLSNTGNTIKPAPTMHPLPINDIPHIHNQVIPMDSIAIMQVCAELGLVLDSPPPMPCSRKYTISASKNHNLYKIPLPQLRLVKGHFTDPTTKISLSPGTLVTVLHPSNEDRSKFTVCAPCYNNTDAHMEHIDMPHQLTQRP